MQREARALARPGVEIVAGGGDAARLAAELDAAAPRAEAIISVGLAGALVAGLYPGDWVIDCGRPDWRLQWQAALPRARIGKIVGSTTAIATIAAKQALHLSDGGVAVDMESGIAAEVAARHGSAFAAVRVISDSVDHQLPPAALVGMAADGTMDLGAVLASLARHPAQLPALIRTGWAAEKAFRALRTLKIGAPPA